MSPSLVAQLNPLEMPSFPASGSARKRKAFMPDALEMDLSDPAAECWQHHSKRINSSDFRPSFTANHSGCATPSHLPPTPTSEAWVAHSDLSSAAALAHADSMGRMGVQCGSAGIAAAATGPSPAFTSGHPAAGRQTTGDCELCKSGSQGHLQHIWAMRLAQQQQQQNQNAMMQF
ncbi:hypothetical protein HDU98_010752 [Podochytrium sp. JEL0797]|nr:hypothetical protein HDU98_010752 [Podochytrium sp. JEL0797]